MVAFHLEARQVAAPRLGQMDRAAQEPSGRSAADRSRQFHSLHGRACHARSVEIMGESAYLLEMFAGGAREDDRVTNHDGMVAPSREEIRS